MLMSVRILKESKFRKNRYISKNTPTLSCSHNDFICTRMQKGLEVID
jgi:hypothetical protein